MFSGMKLSVKASCRQIFLNFKNITIIFPPVTVLYSAPSFFSTASIVLNTQSISRYIEKCLI